RITQRFAGSDRFGRSGACERGFDGVAMPSAGLSGVTIWMERPTAGGEAWWTIEGNVSVG
ncbi:MAG: hypothetical protein ACKOGA_12320, partial [Planctomycetaceae bacterium]